MMFFVELFGGSKNPMNFFCLVAQVTGTGALAAEGVSNSHAALDIWFRFVRGACHALTWRIVASNEKFQVGLRPTN